MTTVYFWLFAFQVAIDFVIMLSVFLTGAFNNYMVEKTERKAFLEIRTCIESRHTIAKENQHQVYLSITCTSENITRDHHGHKTKSAVSYDHISLMFKR